MHSSTTITEPKVNLAGLQSEGRNPNSLNIDSVSTHELCRIINNEDRGVSESIVPCLPVIAAAIDELTSRALVGGRVIYVGAGTSGRLGVLDASELPPTYSADPQQFIAIIAGGDKALRKAQEGAEDNITLAVDDLKDLRLDGSKDVLIGIAASGRTPYVLSCLKYAKSLGCTTVGVSCCSPSAMSLSGDVKFMIEAVTGAEVVTGSTRMKAGTATKMILNMLSSGVMIKLGKTFSNMMVDVQATNLKLEQRARNIIREVCGSTAPASDNDIDLLLRECKGSVKLAIASILLHLPTPEASEHLQTSSGVLSLALERNNSSHVLQESRGRTNGWKRQYVLCVDGGGSKCAAAIGDGQNNISTGTSGGCNLSDGNIDLALSNVATAVHNAVSAIPDLKEKLLSQIEFSKVFIGMAGFDRAHLADRVRRKLNLLFNRTDSRNIIISNDVQLVATIAGDKANAQNVIVLIAGTGSVAMMYRKGEDMYECVMRRGGWGCLLGDDGSGFDIGRKAIRHALMAIDATKCSLKTDEPMTPFNLLTEKVIDHFQGAKSINRNPDLLSEIIYPGCEIENEDKKKRIANVAKAVLDIGRTDSIAQSIIVDAGQELTKLVKNIVRSSNIDFSNTVLAVTGGLMSNEQFQQNILNNLSAEKIDFRTVVHVSNPAQEGAEYCMKLCHNNRNN